MHMKGNNLLKFLMFSFLTISLVSCGQEVSSEPSSDISNDPSSELSSEISSDPLAEVVDNESYTYPFEELQAIKGSNNTFAPINKPSDADGERPVGNGLLIIDPTTSVMTGDLNAKISEATNLMNNSQYGNEIGKYPEEQKNILNIAIVNAKAAKVAENKNQESYCFFLFFIVIYNQEL